MKAVFGLGNPGLKYAVSRHNIGFHVVDLYRKTHCHRARARLCITSLIYRCDGLLLVKPMTFMNASGDAVRRVLDHEDVDLEEALVVYDDLDLPLGSLRLRPFGGAGSHNGMQSVLDAVGSQQIPRMRIGIEAEGRTATGADFVLDRFTEAEWKALLPTLEAAVEAIDVFFRAGLEAAMTRFNRAEL